MSEMNERALEVMRQLFDATDYGYTDATLKTIAAALAAERAAGVAAGWAACREQAVNALLQVEEKVRHEGRDDLIVCECSIAIRALTPPAPAQKER